MSISILNSYLSGIAALVFAAVWVATGTTPTAPEQPDNLLDLTRADSVRVSLFSFQPPDTVRLASGETEWILWRDDNTLTVSEDTLSTTLYYREQSLTAQFGNETYRADSVSIRSKGSVRVITDEFGYRYYRGKVMIKPNQNRNVLDIVNTTDLESYVASVVGSEMDFHEPNALKAQAVVSRTYALWSLKKSPYPDFDLRDHEASQVYIGEIQDKPRYRQAADSTTGEILTWSDHLILAVFSSTCGGATSSNRDVWSGKKHPYLQPQQDAEACSLSPHFNWSYTLKKDEFKKMVLEHYGFRYHSAKIRKTSGLRVDSIALKNSSGNTLQFSGNEFRLFINRHTNPLAIRSTKFEWDDVGDEIIIEGRGLGHAVGMCQWGARGLANAGWDYKDILTFYFSGTKVVPLSQFETNQIALYN